MLKAIRQTTIFMTAFAVMIISAVFVLSRTAGAATGAFVVEGGTENTDYSYENGVLTIKTSTSLTIKNADPAVSTEDRIYVSTADKAANITLAGVNIAPSSDSAFEIDYENTGTVTLILAANSTNTLKGGTGAGLEKHGSNCELVIQGDGCLYAEGANKSAGIGGNKTYSGEKITIKGGIITAIGGECGSGIGGGSDGGCSDIKITGGSVKAVAGRRGGDDDAADIGGGAGQGSCTPTNEDYYDVYLFELDTTGISSVIIDGKSYPTKHGTEDKLYAYLTSDFHTVEFGENGTEKFYVYDNDTQTFIEKEFGLVITGDDLVYGTDYEYRSYKYSADELFISTDKPVTISNRNGVNKTDCSICVANINAKITLDGVNIESSDPAIDIASGDKEVEIILADNSTNILKGMFGISTGLIDEKYTGSVTIKGNGYLEAIGDEAGIGVYYYYGGANTCGGKHIIIESGIITASGGNTGGAGIGGSYLVSVCNDIIIKGGSVKATGGSLTYNGVVYTAPAIGTGVQYDSDSGTFSNGIPVTPTNGSGDNVYLFELDTTGISSVTIDGKSYPTKHGTEDKLYLYLSENANHTIKLDDAETTYKWCGDVLKIVPSASDFSFTAPESCVYTGSGIEAAVTAQKTDMGEITVKYYDKNGTKLDNAPVEPGTYVVKIDVAECAKYADATDITSESWTFTITGGNTGDSGNNGNNNSGNSGNSGGYSGGHSSNSTREPSKPEINGKSQSWSDVAAEIKTLTKGNSTTINLNGNYNVPADVIKAIADSGVKATFVVDSWRSWTIDGSKIDDLSVANLTVIQIASLDSSSLRGTAGAKFRIEGTNIPAELTLTFKKDYAGKFANLYRKDGDKLVFVDTVKVDANGNAVLTNVSESGDYVVMLGDYSDRPGDMDNDGKLTAMDASGVLKYVLGISDSGNLEAADMDGDGKITALDASLILKKTMGLV